jgi:Tol biopolymer transport system component
MMLSFTHPSPCHSLSLMAYPLPQGARVKGDVDLCEAPLGKGRKKYAAFVLLTVLAFFFIHPAGVALAGNIPGASSNGSPRNDVNSWVMYESPNFRIHVRDRSFRPLAEEALSILEDAQAEFAKPMGAHLDTKLSVFLYKNRNDFLSSNIARGGVDAGTAGFEDPVKFRIAVYPALSRRDFRITLRQRLAAIHFFRNIFGDSASVLRFLQLAWKSEWVKEGLSQAYGGVFEPYQRMILNDAIRHATLFAPDDFHRFGYMRPEERRAATAQSFAMFQSVSRKWGAEKLGGMFRAYRDGFSNSAFFQKTLGVSLGDFYSRWVASERQGMKERDEADSISKLLSHSPGHPASFISPVPIAGSNSIAYISNDELRDEIYIQTRDGNGWKRKAMTGSNRLICGPETIRKQGSPLSVSADGKRLYFFGDRAAKEFLWRIDVATGALDYFPVQVDDAYSPAVSPDGKKVVFTGVKNGSVNLYIWEYETGLTTKLTTHEADDGYPAWSPDGLSIVFSRQIDGQWDLYAISADGLTEKRLTDTPVDEIAPSFSQDVASVYFSASVEDGYQLYRLDMQTGAVNELTSVNGGAFRPRQGPDGLLFEHYGNMSSSIRLLNGGMNPPGHPVGFSPKPDQPDAVRQTNGASNGQSEETETFTEFSSNYSFPLILASFGDQPSNNEFVWTFGLRAGVVSPSLSADHTRAFAVPRAELNWVNKYYPFDIFGGVFYQFRDIGDTGDNATAFSERDQYGGSAGVSMRVNDRVSIGAGFVGYVTNKRLFANDDFGYHKETGLLAQAQLNNLYADGLLPVYGYSLNTTASWFSTAMGGDYGYDTLSATGYAVAPAVGAWDVEAKFSYDQSGGQTPRMYDLGWEAGVKGVLLNKYEASRRFVGRVGLRRELLSGSRVSFLNSTLRNVSATLFTDAGAVSGADVFTVPAGEWKKSAGVHLRLDVYWMQSIGFPIGMYYARETDGPDSVFSLTFGAGF